MVEYASVRSSLYDIDSLVSQLNERAGDGWEVVQILPTGGDVTAVLRRSDAGSDGAPEAEAPAASGDLDALATGAAAGGTVAAFEQEEVVEETAGSDGAFGGEVVTDTTVEVSETVGDATDSATDAASDAADTAGDSVTDAGEVAAAAGVASAVATESPEPPSWASSPGAAAAEPAGWASAPDEAAPEATTRVEEAPAAADEAVSDHVPAAAAAAAVAGSAPAEPVAEAPAAAPTPPPAPAPTAPSIPGGWYPDPSNRYELRYWDGNAWTEHVARQGQMYTDPPVA